MLCSRWFLAVCLSLANGVVPAADPPKDALPAPKPAPAVLGSGQIRCDRYAVWQFYGVDRWGQFKPLVINTPWGAYFLSNGAPFPWTTTHPLEFMLLSTQ